MRDPPTNMIGQSQSGTGKTAAFVLNVLKRVDLAVSAPQAVVMAPSRELARQILGVVQAMGQFMKDLSIEQAVSDSSTRGKKFEAQIIVGTSGTLREILKRRQLNPTNVKVLVLDEADSMLAEQNLGPSAEVVKR